MSLANDTRRGADPPRVKGRVNSLQQRHEVRLRGLQVSAWNECRARGLVPPTPTSPRSGGRSQPRTRNGAARRRRGPHRRLQSAKADFVCLLQRVHSPFLARAPAPRRRPPMTTISTDLPIEGILPELL